MPDPEQADAEGEGRPAGGRGFPPIRLRFSIADGVMLILAAASASALFAKILELVRSEVDFPYDYPTVVILAIVLTAVALGAYKAHSVAQVLLQVTLGCLGFLTLLSLSEAEYPRGLFYWLQAGFALIVAGPMLARRYVKASMPRGPRRSWWKKTLEAVIFSYVNMLLVAFGVFLEVIIVTVVGSMFS